MVAEADESDRSFLKLFPTIAVMTNIDHEHLENYGGFDDLQQAFVDFANKVPFYGAVIACADDPRAGGGVAAPDAARDDVRPDARLPISRRATSSPKPMGITASVKRRAPARRRSGRLAGDARIADAAGAGPAQPAERAGGRRRRGGARAVLRAGRGRPRGNFAARSGDSRFAASRTASSSSTTTDIIRPRSRRFSRRPVRSAGGSSSRFSRIASRGPRR